MSSPRILIVEDETIVARDIGEQLGLLGYEPVGFCIRGEEVLAKAELVHPDLVLMDINLAGEMDGIEAARLIRDHLGLPVVFLTAFAERDTFDRAIGADPFGYVLKPFTERELRTVIDIALFKHESVRKEREAREFLETIIQTAQDSYLLTDAQGRILSVNAACEVLTGYTERELMQMTVTDLDADRGPAELSERLALIARKGPLNLDQRLRRKDGGIRDLELSAQSIAGHDGRLVFFARDVSERKVAEEMLKRSEERYRLLFDHNPLPMWLFDQETLGFIAVNKAAIENYGYTREEFLEMKIPQVHPVEDVDRIRRSLGGEEESSASESEWKHCRKDGTVFPVEIISQNLEFDGRSVRLVMAEDVSEKKELQEQFFRAQRLESLGLLASGIAHDLNNMLAPVLFSAPLLRSQVKTAQDHHILDLLEKSAARGSSLVRQILSIAQGSSSELRTTQVKHIARDVVSVLEVTLPRNITLKTNIITDAWPVDANPTQIHQVLLNLGVNARDAMPSGGQLSFAVLNRKLDDAAAAKIKGGRSGNWLVVEVADTGTGIPEAVLERMWDSFFTTKAEGKGSGLGLATVRSMVELHRGFVEVETVEKKGTVFRVFLPATETVGAGSQSSHPFPAARGRTELIMVVDDDEMVREITQAVLTDFGDRWGGWS